MRRRGALAIVAAVALTTGCGAADGGDAAGTEVTTSPAAIDQAAVSLPTVTVHKTASCECCGQYEAYLTSLGVEIEVEIHDDVGPLKDAFGVPDEARSCHTNEVAGYFVEGHVPIEAIVVLLDEAPEVDGIALAGMPAGSPGMPGDQTEPFVVTTAADGEVVGELGQF